MSIIVIFNKRETPDEIAGIKTGNTLKYLRITTNDSRSLFKEYTTLMMDKAARMATMTCSLVAWSFARMLTGETYWKKYKKYCSFSHIIRNRYHGFYKTRKKKNSKGLRIV